MKIKEIKSPLGDSVFSFKHPSGLDILVMPKPGFAGVNATFSTKYGSIDTSVMKDDGSFETIPAGTAHFLEHKLFESEDLGAFERYAKTGASANAFTSFERTAYYFECTENFEQSLEILLDFVQKPYFTQETVEKEQGIIGQEIRMYQDIPDWQITFNLLRALYYTNPVCIEACGTQESIAEITADLLHKLYHQFYDLNNMVLAVCGNTDVKAVAAVADKCLAKSTGKPAVRKFEPENPKPLAEYTHERMSVAGKMYLLGFKEDIQKPELTLKEEIASQIMLEAVAGKASPLFKQLVDANLADNGFHAILLNGFGYSCVMAGGNCDEPEKAAQMIRDEFDRLGKSGLSPEVFERARRDVYGGMVRGYDSIDYIANLLTSMHFAGCKPFEELEVCKGITLDDVNSRLAAVRSEYSALSVISPIV